MSLSLNLRFLWVFALLGLLLPINAHAKRHALLIGVGDYADVRTLDGPANDIAELEKVALGTWQVPAENVTKLVDSQATRANILTALDQLDQRTQPGDWVFIYFSGHGTSSQGLEESGVKIAQLPDDSGAFLPADFRKKSADGKTLDATALLRQMVVGRWDLKPRLMKLDQKGVQSFVVVDACFSENAFRALASRDSARGQGGVSRFVSLGDAPAGAGDCAHCIDSEKVRSYNYQNTVVFFASANDQTAEDVSLLSLNSGHYSTLSNKPHGLFSDSLLRALSDIDESQNSFESLFQASKKHMHRNCGGKCKQDPGMMPIPEADTLALLSKNVIGSTAATAPIQNDSAKAKTISIGEGFQRLREQVKRNADFILQGDNADISLEKHQGDWAFFTRGGAKIVNLQQVERHFPQWLSSRTWLAMLDAEIDRRSNDFELTLRNGDGMHGDVALLGSKLYFSINVEQAASVLILDINPEGDVFVLYPAYENELAQVPAATTLKVPDIDQKQWINIDSPFGQDAVWVLAFSEPSDLPLLQDFQRSSDAALDPRGTLMRKLRHRLTQAGGVAQRRLNLFTLKD